MIEMLNSIPESIGWAMVGALSAFCVVMFVKVLRCVIEMIAEHIEAKREEELENA